MAACLCCISFLPSNAETQGKWKPLFGNNLEDATYNPEVWSMKDGVLSATKMNPFGQRPNTKTSNWIWNLRQTKEQTAVL